MRFQYMPYLTTGITARRPMVLDHLADHWSGPVQWTNGPDQSEILINGPNGPDIHFGGLI